MLPRCPLSYDDDYEDYSDDHDHDHDLDHDYDQDSFDADGNDEEEVPKNDGCNPAHLCVQIDIWICF